ncbi:hypothetical protein [Desulfomicrobium salsuginis]
MPKDNTPRHDCASSPISGQEVDYTPKNYSLRESIPTLLKFMAIAGFIFFVFWFYESR